ncbi:MAG: hypothetical protein LBT36_01670 [Oscillospiraceae bacterium]|nr:hypothetical protein [Oscillospiraceae bacterium]
MTAKISELLDCVRDTSAAPRATVEPEVSEARIRQLTLAKIALQNKEDTHLKTNLTEQAPRRGSRLRRAALIAAAVAAALIVSATALAAAGVLDLRTLYSSVFDNPEAAEYVVPGAASPGASDGENAAINVNLLDAYTEGNRAYLRFELADLDENAPDGRLGGVIYIDFGGNDMESGFAETQYDAASRTAIAMIRHAVGAGETQTLRVARILTGVESVSGEPLDFDLAAHLGMTRAVALGGGAFAEITAVTLNGTTLAITHRPTEGEVGNLGLHTLALLTPDGSEIVPFGGAGSAAGDYANTHYFDLGGYNLGALTLTWIGLRAAEIIEIDRAFTFDTSKRIEPRALTAELDGKSLALTLGATRLEFTLSPGYVGDWQSADTERLERVGGGVKLTLRDGTEIIPQANGIMWDAESADFAYDLVFTPPDTVVSVTIDGRTFAFAA